MPDLNKVKCPCCKYYNKFLVIDEDQPLDDGFEISTFVCKNCGNIFAHLVEPEEDED